MLKGFKDKQAVEKLEDGSIDLVIPDTVKTINKGAFSGKNDGSGGVVEGGGLKLKSVVIPSSVTTIGEEAFYACNKLTKVTFNEGLKTIDKWAFDQCALTELNLPSTLESLNQGAFKWCDYLSDVILPQNLKTLGASVFENCFALQSINIPKGIKKVEDLVFNDTAIRSLFIPSTVECIGEEAMQYIDYKNHDFKAIVLPNDIKLAPHPFICASNDAIIAWTRNLFIWTTSPDVKSNLESKTTDQGDQLYYPGTVNVLNAKGDIYICNDKEFAGLTAKGRRATSLTIPAYISSVPNFTFTECSNNLKEITFESNTINFDQHALYGLPQNITYRVYDKKIRDQLVNMGIKTNSIEFVASLSTSPGKIAAIVTTVVILAIAGLATGILIPMRKQHKINVLNAKLTNRRIDRLATSNAMAFKKVIEVTGAIRKDVNQIRALGPVINQPQNIPPQPPRSFPPRGRR